MLLSFPPLLGEKRKKGIRKGRKRKEKKGKRKGRGMAPKGVLCLPLKCGCPQAWMAGYVCYRLIGFNSGQH